MRLTPRLAVVSLLTLASWITPLFATEALCGPKLLMAAAGDSLTAASLADTELTRDLAPTQAEDRGFLYENKDTYSWATGKKIFSHYERLRLHLARSGFDGTLEAINVAVPGSETSSFAKQAQEIVSRFYSGKFDALTYVVFTLGGNDVCRTSSAGTEPHARFRENLLSGFAALASIRQRTPVRILISSLPKITELGKPEIRDHRAIGNLSCGRLRALFKQCVPLTNWGTQEDRLRAERAVEAHQRELEAVAHEAMRLYPQLSIHFGRSIEPFDLEPKFLARDCFHPSAQGQALFSELLWRDLPWFR